MRHSNRIVAFPVTTLVCPIFTPTRPSRSAAWPAVLLSIICLLCMPALAPAQTQLGGDIDGEAANDGLHSVSLSSDGSRLAVGTGNNAGPGDAIHYGHARVYQWSGSAWTQMGTDIDGEAAGDQSGDAISLSADGSRVAIGAMWNSGGGSYRGHVRVYQWSGSDWEQLGADIDGSADFDHSGTSVSLSSDGSLLAIVAADNDGYVMDAGQVRIFRWSGSEWIQLGDDIYGEMNGDNISSASLSSDGSRVAIGADANDGNGDRSGHTRVFEWAGESWTQLGTDIDGEASRDGSGHSVSLSSNGDRVAIGAFGNDGNGTDSGHVRVYQWSGTSWTQLGDDIDGEAASDYSGNSVSLSADGNRLAVGAYENDGNGAGSGQVRIYQWSDSSWSQVGSAINGEEEGDRSGYAVSLSSNGNRVAISADRNDAGDPHSWTGHVRVYDLSMFNTFQINPGLNDAWYFPTTDGQGFFITVFPELGKVSLAWFTYDTEQPPPEATANFGDPGHRWLTALGRYTGNQATMRITFASGGLFDTPDEVAPVTRIKDGTIILTFDSCNSGTAEYDIPSLGISGIVPIERVVDDNVALCEAFLAQ